MVVMCVVVSVNIMMTMVNNQPLFNWTLVQCQHNVSHTNATMHHILKPQARPCATTPQSVRPTPQQPSFTALPLTPARHATPTPKGPPGIMLLSTVADILELDAL